MKLDLGNHIKYNKIMLPFLKINIICVSSPYSKIIFSKFVFTMAEKTAQKEFLRVL